jgi:uncharacterized protein (DUF1684 family)
MLIILATFFSIRSFTPEPIEFRAGDILAFRKMKDRMISAQVGAPFFQDPAFDSLVYYPPNEQEVYQTEFYRTEEGQELDLMPDRPGYPSHKVAGFVVLEKEVWKDTLYVLKDLKEESDSLFFVPFQDQGNGKGSYGGGRYLDLVIRPGKQVIVDFNFAYNPYCAYKSDFVCARIPEFNRLSRIIESGEKDYPGAAH